MKHTEGKVEADNGKIRHNTGTCIAVCQAGHGDKKQTHITIDALDANAERIAALWNAADGMTTEQAVKYIEHGAEAIAMLKLLNGIKEYRDVTNFLLEAE